MVRIPDLFYDYGKDYFQLFGFVFADIVVIAMNYFELRWPWLYGDCI